MAFPNDTLASPGGSVALQSVSVVFNATALASGMIKPPFKSSISPNGLPQPGVQLLDVFTIDAILQEVHEADAEITEHPVEVGADITDHVRPKPITVRMEGLISNTPIDNSLLDAVTSAVPGLGLGVAAYGTVQGLLKGASAVRSAFDRLYAIRDNGQAVGLFTPYRSYGNMVMASLSIPRDQTTGDALRFTALFRQIILVNSGLTTIQLPTLAQSAQSMGTQGTPTAPKSVTQSASALYTGVNNATNGGLDSYKTWVNAP